LLLNVAKIGGSVGIKGEVRLAVLTDDPSSRFVKGAEFVLETAQKNHAEKTDAQKKGNASTPEDTLKALTISGVRRQGGSYIAHFEGVDSRTAADELRGGILQVQVDLQAEVEGDEYYYASLAGLEVRQIGGESGRDESNVLGVVKSVVRYPAQDLLEVSVYETANLKAGRVLVPFVKQIVKAVNLSEKYLEVDLPGGLLDEVY
jgi:16S rRNA processing protein RimM